jgi:hypothetical protein
MPHRQIEERRNGEVIFRASKVSKLHIGGIKLGLRRHSLYGPSRTQLSTTTPCRMCLSTYRCQPTHRAACIGSCIIMAGHEVHLLKATTDELSSPASFEGRTRSSARIICESPKVNNSEGPMVNVINAISGGSNEPVHETKRQRKDYLRAINHVCEGKHFRTRCSHILITFAEANLTMTH